MRRIETEITIHAPTEKVWKTLTDFERHPSWNPFIKSISGEKKAGELLKVHIQPPGGSGMTFEPQVLACHENKEFRWKGKLLFSGLFDGEHYFILQPINPYTTRFIHGEAFSGILVSIFGSMLDKTKAGFELMNAALKEECEK